MKLSPREIITILTVYKDKRDLGRISCFYKSRLEECLSLISELGLKHRIYDNHLIYLSKKEDLIEKAIQLHHFSNGVEKSKSGNTVLGKLYGYPDCCIRMFEGNTRLTKQNDDLGILLKSLENSKSNIFPIYTNWFFTCKPVLHLPHSFDCQDSVKIGKQNLKILKEYDKKIYDSVIKKLTACVLIHKDRVLLINDFNPKGRNVIFKSQPWLDMSSLFNPEKSFKENSWLDLLLPFESKGVYKIGFKNSKIKVMVFSNE